VKERRRKIGGGEVRGGGELIKFLAQTFGSSIVCEIVHGKTLVNTHFNKEFTKLDSFVSVTTAALRYLSKTLKLERHEPVVINCVILPGV
jgi:hypothetical protein